MDPQQLYEKYQTIEAQRKNLEQEFDALQERIIEAKASVLAIKAFETLRPDTELLVPIINGILFKAKLLDNTSLFMNVGAGCVVDKKPKDVLEALEKNIEELNLIRQQMSLQIIDIQKESALIEKEVMEQDV